MIYLDNAATTRPFDEVIEAIQKTMAEIFFNTSALYYKAVEADNELNRQRVTIAGELGVDPCELIFTSGGTESNNLAILGTFFTLRKNHEWHFITSEVEHPSVYNIFKFIEKNGYQVTYLPVDRTGCVDPQMLFAAMRPNTAIVSIMHVNNETGAANDISALIRAAKSVNPNVVFHSDGAQAFMKVRTRLAREADMYSMSAHKLCGPKGVGALFARNGLRFAGVMIGGGQEGGARSGTVNLPGIVGFGTAVKIYSLNRDRFIYRMRECKSMLARYITSIEDVTINGVVSAGAPNILSATFKGVLAEHLLHMLEEKEIFVATGSACSSRKRGNRVLEAMGLSETDAASTLRFSFSPYTTAQEIAYAAQEIRVAVNVLRKLGRKRN